MLTNEQITKFDMVLQKVLTSEHRREGIGTLGERTLHLVLKEYFEPNRACHEQKVGRYVADIKNETGITEIQTRGFAGLRRKLTEFSKSYPVNVVYPVSQTRHICWLDPNSGEVTERRKSPKRGHPWDILYELYALRPIMPLTNVTFTLVFVDTDDFKLLCGWSSDRKRGSSRYERIPTAIYDIITLANPEDYSVLVPPELGEKFTASEFAKSARMTKRTAGYAIQTLVTLGVIEHTETIGKAYVYKRKDLLI